MSTKPHFLEPLLKSGEITHVLMNERTGTVVAHELELAGDSRTRTRGLLGRSGIAPGAAMIIAPCNAVHTFFMQFTIDVVFADRSGRVVRLCRRLRPWRIGIGLRGFAAVELEAGSIEKAGIAAGDRLVIAQK